MAEVSVPASPLFYRLRFLRRVLPLASSFAGFIYEFIEHRMLAQPAMIFLGEILFYAIIGPLLIFLAFTWLLNRVAERDVAEARLAVLYDVSRQSAAAGSLDELQEIALSVPKRVGLLHAASMLIVQDGPGRPWLLARTRGFSDADVAAIQTGLASRQDQPDCIPEHTRNPHVKLDCPLLRALAMHVSSPSRLAFALSLSRQPFRRVMMGVYFPSSSRTPSEVAEILEPLAAGLALAMDRASLRARERQLLQQVRHNVATQEAGLIPTFERILADIAAEHPIAAAAIYLLRDEGSHQRLVSALSWPDPQACEVLAESALDVLRTSRHLGVAHDVSATISDSNSPSPFVLALPITNEDEVLGALVLSAPAASRLPHPSILDVVTSMMALMIRNSQLYGRLESQALLEERNHFAREVHDGVAQALGFYNFKVQQVQRLLGRGDVNKARAALQELRAGSQEVYGEVRRMIQELSGTGDSEDFMGSLQQYCRIFTGRTGLRVSLDVAPEAQLPADVQDQLLGVVREALNNAHQHGRARHVAIRLCKTLDGITLTIQDNGAGMQYEHRSGDHFGLRIMRQRVQSLGGEFKVLSGNGEGTVVDVRIPALMLRQRHEEELWSALVS